MNVLLVQSAKGLRVCGLASVIAIGIGMSSAAATNTFAVVNSGTTAYVINGTSNPNLALVRGFVYTFQITASGHPFWIKTIQGTGTGNAYANGVSGNGADTGPVTFAVPTNAPSLLFYNCQFHSSMTGQLNIENPPIVRITGAIVETNSVLLTSTGTAALNVGVETSSNLLDVGWVATTVATNSYAGGTNTTRISLSPEPVLFFRVSQGLP